VQPRERTPKIAVVIPRVGNEKTMLINRREAGRRTLTLFLALFYRISRINRLTLDSRTRRAQERLLVLRLQLHDLRRIATRSFDNSIEHFGGAIHRSPGRPSMKPRGFYFCLYRSTPRWNPKTTSVENALSKGVCVCVCVCVCVWEGGQTERIIFVI